MCTTFKPAVRRIIKIKNIEILIVITSLFRAGYDKHVNTSTELYTGVMSTVHKGKGKKIVTDHDIIYKPIK